MILRFALCCKLEFVKQAVKSALDSFCTPAQLFIMALILIAKPPPQTSVSASELTNGISLGSTPSPELVVL